jgi:hypothetical protein
MKVFGGDKDYRISEVEFFKRYYQRRPLTRERKYERYRDKYRTIFNYLYVSYNERKLFWHNFKRDYENDKLDCFKEGL